MTGEWKSIVRLDKNTHGRDFVCGDIHGCFDELEFELRRISFNKKIDRLFCVGDLIDRGPKSALAVTYMTCHWFFSVIGNHETMFLMANLNLPEQKVCLENHIMSGGRWAYKMALEDRKALLYAIDKLPLIIQAGDAIIVHAALPPVESLEEIEKDPRLYMNTVLWFRGEYPPVVIPEISKIYVGHSIVKNPTQNGKYVNIDTGAFQKYQERAGKLTVVELGKV